ncbi:DUF1156 domain-containing protein [bacterium]|nr:DUF1156 domain-containing protein [bacterium]
MTYRKKLIEVALPLEAINQASAREKSIRHGHPSTLHLWWARRPLAACRAVLFASLVDDPSSHPEKFPTEEIQEKERQRLFDIIKEVVKWENSNNERVLSAARAEILASTGGNPPPIYDPFCGGGSIPLEAQRLGLEVEASDLNPVAVLITKALIEIPPKFANRPPVNPKSRTEELHSDRWRGSAGLAEDVRYYGNWIREEGEKSLGKLYPKVRLPKEHGGGEATVIAWLWARTVKCPNPACGAEMPLVRSFILSTKRGKQAHIVPIVSGNEYQFDVKNTGKAPEAPKIGRGAKFRCICCGLVAPDDHIKHEGSKGRMGARLMAIVAEGPRGRIYLPPDSYHENIIYDGKPQWLPDGELAVEPRAIWCTLYGLRRISDIFTTRQLIALTTLSDLVKEARELVLKDAGTKDFPDDPRNIEAGGEGAQAYADAVATYLALAVSKLADSGNSLVSWKPSMDQAIHLFTRQGIPMMWDYAEPNMFCEGMGDFGTTLKTILRSLENHPAIAQGRSQQADASIRSLKQQHVVCTDPPYYDNIGYADLSDFFYAWLRPTLKRIFPQLFATMQVPKSQELVASPYRFEGNKDKARSFFEEGLGRAFERMRESQDPKYPLTVYYAFKQSETEDGDKNDDANVAPISTGWETMLVALLKAGFSIHGTWPMRSEMSNRMVAAGTNALASSIVLVCRPRPDDLPLATRKEFLSALKSDLPHALKDLQRGNIAPVDLAQASIGPGMSIFTRYAKVMESDGSAMKVRTALALINQVLDEVLAEQEGEFDAETRWALAWFEQHGMEEGAYGVAETLSKAKNTSVKGMEEAGVVKSRGGKVRLVNRSELPENWDPAKDSRLTVWEVALHLAHALDQDGEDAAAALLRRVGSYGEIARELAYRLYTISERKKWSQEAQVYNSLVISWPEISRLSQGIRKAEQIRIE